MTHAGRTVTALLALACGAAPVLAATPHPPARKAFVASPAGRSDCLAGVSLSHAAYLPGATTGKVAGCGHLLSTDTLVTVHHWDRT